MAKERLSDEKFERIWREKFGRQERHYYETVDRERCWLRRDSEAEFHVPPRRERKGAD